MIKLLLTAVLYFILNGAMAQNVGINNTDPKAALDLNGGLRTRVLTLSVSGAAVTIPANKSFIWLEGAPAAGFTITIDASYTDGSRLVVYNGTGKEGFIAGAESVFPGKITEMIFLDGEWRSIGTNNTVNQWNLTGNSGTDTAFNFIGTTDNKPLKFKVNNKTAGVLDANNFNTAFGADAFSKYKSDISAGNVAIGNAALSNDTTGNSNTAVGFQSMAVTQSAGGQNTAVGSYSLRYNRGLQNSAFGSEALAFNYTGNYNTALGAYAYTNKTDGTGNTAVGTMSMSPSIYSSASGNYNTAVGMHSLKNNRTGSGAVAIGYQTAYSDTAAEGIIAIGRSALFNNINKTGNLAIGDSTLFNNSTGASGTSQATNNLAIGDKALKSNTTGYNNVAIGRHSLINNTVGTNNIAIGTDALFSNQANSRNIVIGDSSMYKTGELTYPEPVLSEKSVDNIVLGRKSLYQGHKVFKNISIGNYTNYNGEWAERNVTIGDSAMYNNYEGADNVAIGNNSMNGGPNARYNYSGGNVAIGSFSLYNSGDPYFNSGHNTAIGYYSGYSNHGDAFSERTGNVFLGNLSGFFAQSANKLYIENTNADSLSALIYGDFAADSLLLNAKTVVRNNAVVKGYTKLGGYGTEVPSIKMKKITGTGPAVNGNLTVAHGLDASKIISVQIFMQYGAAPTPTKVLPPGYTLIAGYEYQFEIDGANILITNKGLNSANIGNKPFRIFITYEE